MIDFLIIYSARLAFGRSTFKSKLIIWRCANSQRVGFRRREQQFALMEVKQILCHVSRSHHLQGLHTSSAAHTCTRKGETDLAIFPLLDLTAAKKIGIIHTLDSVVNTFIYSMSDQVD
jgi:hypothetical protein